MDIECHKRRGLASKMEVSWGNVKMRYLILSDIHSNLEAFQAVLGDASARGGFDEVWCLGDIVGYGPSPRECITLLRQQRHVSVAGNHDWGALGKLDLAYFNPEAAFAGHWTAQQLSAEDKGYLQGLPTSIGRDIFTLVHGSPRDPIWEYLFSPDVAKANFYHFEGSFCLVGHTHVPVIFEYLGERERCASYLFPADASLNLDQRRLIINPGSVGQPRDGDPRASYAILDSEKGAIHHYRVPYDISLTQRKMRQAKLPQRLIDRLSYGW